MSKSSQTGFRAGVSFAVWTSSRDLRCRLEVSRQLDEVLTCLGDPVQGPLHLGGLSRRLLQDQAGQSRRRVRLAIRFPDSGRLTSSCHAAQHRAGAASSQPAI